MQSVSQQALEVLKTRFGYDRFRLSQAEIIQNVMHGRDTFVLMPTGGGKSLCYQVPALLLGGVTLVISPLIALMKDQVDALRMNGIPAAFLNSSLSGGEQDSILRDLRNNQLKLLYVSPERLLGNNGFLLKALASCRVSLFAIDEAHCISSWGHDFRPEYLQLSQLKQMFPAVPVIALTATADSLTRRDILEKLELRAPETFVSSFNRSNITYLVEPKRKSYDRLTEYLRKQRGNHGIVYALSRDSVESLAERLSAEGFSALPYHAGLDRQERERNQELFLRDEVQVMVATIAFGMGINKSNVRFVVHMDLPKNIESYYQETGRAGRDGITSEALLFYSGADVIKLKSFAVVEGNPEQSSILLKKLDKMAELCEIRQCRRKYMLNYFGESAPDQCGNCDVCLTQYDLFDATVIAQKALSAVTRLGSSYGANYVIDFLRGSKSEKIRQEHKALKTYGAGADLSREEWFVYLRDLVSLGYLQQSEGSYPVLQLTPKSNLLLKSVERLMLKKVIVRKDVEHTGVPFHGELLNQLKSLRRQIADAENVPAFVVFSDATLLEMSSYLPCTADEVRHISGWGETKIQKYGSSFLQLVRNFCTLHGLSSCVHLKPGRSSARVQRAAKPAAGSDTRQETLALFRKGNNAEQISELRMLSVSTIESHLAHFVLDGQIGILELVPEHKLPALAKAIGKHGDLQLAPIKRELGEDYSYGEIRATINYLKSREKVQ
jgi:ATP-dependent DNA helicase RecQ